MLKSVLRGDPIKWSAKANCVWSVISIPNADTNPIAIVIAMTFIFIMKVLNRTFIIRDVKNSNTFSYFHIDSNKTIRRTFIVRCITKKFMKNITALMVSACKSIMPDHDICRHIYRRRLAYWKPLCIEECYRWCCLGMHFRGRCPTRKLQGCRRN